DQGGDDAVNKAGDGGPGAPTSGEGSSEGEAPADPNGDSESQGQDGPEDAEADDGLSPEPDGGVGDGEDGAPGEADQGTGRRFLQDENVDPDPPPAKPTNRSIGKSAEQNAQCQADVAAAREAGATDIRVNQQQVDAEGNRVGVNRPDLQYTDV